MRIPMDALRRALSDMAGAVEYTAHGPHVLRGMYSGAPIGAVVGGVAGSQDEDIGAAQGAFTGAVGGMALGAGAGGLAKLAHMGGAGAGGFSRGLREALAARAAERGMGRAVSRVAGDMDDAAQFHSSLPGNRQALRNLPQDRVESAIQRLQAQRQYATHPDEIADLDAQIEELTRMLGGGM